MYAYNLKPQISMSRHNVQRQSTSLEFRCYFIISNFYTSYICSFLFT